MSDTQLAVRPKASHQLAAFIGMEPLAMLDTIKAQCFKGNPQNISDAQLAAFVSIAAEMQVNPLLPGMLYAFPIQGGGIVPMMGPDGVYKKLCEHPQIESWETTVYPEDVTVPPTHATCRIYRKGSDKPLTYTALLSEWKVNANPNWNNRPRHMLSLRALKQCARQIIHGVPYDEDERVIMGEINVTPTAEGAPAEGARPEPPKRAKKGAAAVVENRTPATAEKVAETIEAEIVPPSEAKAENPVEQTATPEPVATPVVEKPAVEAPAPLAFLKDGERLETEVEATEIIPFIANVAQPDKTKKPTPSLKLHLKGGFVGEAMHIGGGTQDGEVIKANAPWAVGKKLSVALLGKLNAANGKVAVRVESVKEVQQGEDV